MLILSGCTPPSESEIAAVGKAVTNPIRPLLKAADAVTDPGEPKDFVKHSRPPASKLEYMPVGVQPPDRTTKPKTADEVKAMEAQLDAAREAQQRAAGLPPIGPDGKPVSTPKAKPKLDQQDGQKKHPPTN